jgi:hypothetical protein
VVRGQFFFYRVHNNTTCHNSVARAFNPQAQTRSV